MSFLNPKSPERCHTSRVGGPWFTQWCLGSTLPNPGCQWKVKGSSGITGITYRKRGGSRSNRCPGKLSSKRRIRRVVYTGNVDCIHDDTFEQWIRHLRWKPLPTSIFEPIWWVVSSSFTVPFTLDVYTLVFQICLVSWAWSSLSDLTCILSWGDASSGRSIKRMDNGNGDDAIGEKRIVKWTWCIILLDGSEILHQVAGVVFIIYYKVLYIPGYLSTWCRILLPPH